jgi:hypothetical protein
MVGFLIVGQLRVPLVILQQIEQHLGGLITFPAAVISAYIILGLFHLVDLVVIDGLLGMVIDPRWLRLRGTGPSHWTFRKHLDDFIRAIAVTLPIAAVLGGVSLLIAP